MASPADTESISGTVTDEAGDGLGGISVVLKGTPHKTVTDVDGNYTLVVPKTPKGLSSDARLAFSSPGHFPQTLPVRGRSTIDVRMATDAAVDEEIVVVGYGSKEKTVVSGAIAQTMGAEIQASPASNLAASLAGRLPGIAFSQRSGEPGRDGVSILVRGKSSMGNNSPLVVVDGVPGRDGLDRLDPNDIASITVLKDASAAIYGARAAAGVILVTTKRGALGEPRITYTYNHGFVSPTRLAQMADAYDFAYATNVFDLHSGQPPTYSDVDLQQFLDGSAPLTHPNTDWYDALFKSLSHQSRQNLQITGGSDQVKYFLSLGTSNQDGLYTGANTKFTQYNLRSRIDARITDNLRVSGDIAARREERVSPGSPDWLIYWNTRRQPPTEHAVFPNGSYSQGLAGVNPLAVVREAGYRRRQRDIVQTTLRFEYKIPKVEGLFLDGFLAVDGTNLFQKNWSTPWNYATFDPATNTYETFQSSYRDTISLNEYTQRDSSVTPNVKLNYANTFGDHDISGFLAYEQNAASISSNRLARKQFATEHIQQISAGSADPSEAETSGSAARRARRNYFARASYTYAQRYIFDATARLDGSANFPQGQRYGFFPGVSGAWRLSQENFMQAASAIDELKLRASYGQLGNDRLSADGFPPFLHLETFAPTSAYVTDALQVLSGVRSRGAPVSNLTWETTETVNLGVDSSLLEGKLSFSLDVFRNRTWNMLITRRDAVPTFAGIRNLPQENAGTMINRGLEATVSYSDNFRDFYFNAGGNFAFARNKVTFIDEAPHDEAPWQSKTGRRLDRGLYYETLGIYRTPEDLAAYPARRSGSDLGDLIIRDVNGDGEITDLDKVPHHLNSTPEITFGLNLGASYKGLDLTALLQGQARSILSVGIEPRRGENIYQSQTDYWTPDYPNATLPRITRKENYRHDSDFWLRSSAFLRLKTVEIGYTFPDHIPESIGLGTTRIYISAHNLLTLSAIKEIDPESQSQRTHPQTRIINIGVRASNF
ncbi:MAG: TonB-dependent receptor [Proteobacteria bacterium]|nr:TonB-dependent receptor [Pseudomonadota bacterium]